MAALEMLAPFYESMFFQAFQAAVVEHKKIFFRETAARYDLAKPGSLRVCPPDVHAAQIRSDYRDMREMFFAEAPPFDTVMADPRELEDRVNR